jgi:hypothetical protein
MALGCRHRRSTWFQVYERRANGWRISASKLHPHGPDVGTRVRPPPQIPRARDRRRWAVQPSIPRSRIALPAPRPELTAPGRSRGGIQQQPAIRRSLASQRTQPLWVYRIETLLKFASAPSASSAPRGALRLLIEGDQSGAAESTPSCWSWQAVWLLFSKWQVSRRA